MAINFPHSPSTNETYTVGGKTWRWDGTTWVIHSTIASGIQRSALSAEMASSGTTNFQYNTSTGKFTYTPPDLSGYLTTQYTLPAATTTTLGGVKVGSNITVNSGEISVAAPYSLVTASSTVLGGIKVGTNLSIAAGVLSADAQAPTNVSVTDESTDVECFPLFVTAATGSQPVKSGTNFKFNSSSGEIEAGSFKKTGGQSTAFLKADGSVDSTAYISSYSETSNLANVTARGASTTTACTFQNLTITGNLTVSGTTTTINSATLNIADNQITLNSDVTGAPSENAGLKVERGTSTDVDIRWNETDDKWQFTNDGTNYTNLQGGIPTGGIIMWSGSASAIPTGWALCDGGSGRPDLRGKFVIGASASGGYAVAATGGTADATLVSHSHTINNHTHSFSDSGSFSGNTGYFDTSHTHGFTQNTSSNGDHSHRWGTDDDIGAGGGTNNPDANGGTAWKAFTDTQGAHVHGLPDTGGPSANSNHRHSFSGSVSVSGNTGNPSNTGTNSQGSSATGKNLPPYYAICYIIKT